MVAIWIGSAVAEGVSRRLLTAEPSVRTQLWNVKSGVEVDSKRSWRLYIKYFLVLRKLQT